MPIEQRLVVISTGVRLADAVAKATLDGVETLIVSDTNYKSQVMLLADADIAYRHITFVGSGPRLSSNLLDFGTWAKIMATGCTVHMMSCGVHENSALFRLFCKRVHVIKGMVCFSRNDTGSRTIYGDWVLEVRSMLDEKMMLQFVGNMGVNVLTDSFHAKMMFDIPLALWVHDTGYLLPIVTIPVAEKNVPEVVMETIV